MQFKHGFLKMEFRQIDVRLQGILLAISAYRQYFFLNDIVITSLIRKEDARSVHFYGRGADIRIKDWVPMQAEAIRSWTNDAFFYSNDKKTCLIEGMGDNQHLHIQVPPV